MELRHLRYFIAVAEERSFLRAAARLHMSQPPLSTQIKALETDLGARLFERSTRGISLTAAGAVFLDEARAVIARADQARHAVGRAARGEAGLLAIGFVSIADPHLLPPALKLMRGRHPGIQLQLHELTTDAQVRALLARELDVGIALAPVEDPLLCFEPQLREGLVLAVPAGHPAARAGAAAVSLRAVAAEPFVMVPRPLAPGLHDAVIALCRAHGFVPTAGQPARQMQTVISLVSAGLGVAVVPASLKHLRRPGVRYLRLAAVDPAPGPAARGGGSRKASKRAAAAGPSIVLGSLVRRDASNPALAAFLRTLKTVADGLPAEGGAEERAGSG